MNVLLLDPQKKYAERLQDLSSVIEGANLISADQVRIAPSDSANIDIIVAGFDRADPRTLDALLEWRSHPHTYLIPCWIAADEQSFDKICQWPRLTVDCFDEQLEIPTFCSWLENVAEWQQSRMQLPGTNRFISHSPLELTTSLSLRRATGKLSLFDEEGGEGCFLLHEGYLTGSTLKHLAGTEAFLEFLTWSKGSYLWEPLERVEITDNSSPIEFMFHEALKLFREANLLYHFVPDLNLPLTKTESESALDDGAVYYFAEQKQLYNLIDGKATARQIAEASPLSRLRTFCCLAKWFSLGDVAVVSGEPAVPKRGLLIVDDSHLMCKALRDVFAKDQRFEVLGFAHDGLQALELIEQLNPDVLTLDMQMPRMDGLTALKHIMIRNPKPVVVVSAFTKETSLLTYESFKYGAVDVLTKPSGGSPGARELESLQMRDRVAQASCVSLEAAQYIRGGGRSKPVEDSGPPIAEESNQAEDSAAGLAVILCGSGGFPSLLKLLFSIEQADRLPTLLGSIALSKKAVESMVPNIEKDSSIRMLELSPPGGVLLPNISYLYSFEDCFHISREDNRTVARCDAGCQAEHRPFDHLLFSLGDCFGERAVAILLSGTGRDGVEGMEHVRKQGGKTYVLSPDACLEPGLPRKILEHGFALEVKTALGLASLLQAVGTGNGN
jgi:two-component system, chemotaxis family, protein-glutamate methylesterase/glutaminase